MFTAIYNEKIICSFDVKNKYGNYETEIYEEYKKAGQVGLLKCEECGTSVYLKAGNIKIPHFAHKDSNRSCFFELHKNESEEQVRGKFILYKWLAEQYNNVYLDKKYDNRRANVSIESEKGIIALQYIRNERSLNEWNEKREDYSELGIKDIYFFSFKEFNTENKISEEQFRKIVQKYSSDNIIKMLNTDTNELLLMRYMDVNDENGFLFASELFTQKYNIYDIKFTLDGIIESNFDGEFALAYEKYKNSILEECKKREAERIRNEEIREQILMKQKQEYENRKEAYEKNKKEELEKINNRQDEILEKNRDRYSNVNGFKINELDDEVKQIIARNTATEAEWWQGRTKPIRWINCRYCRRYYTSNNCVRFEHHFGICKNCDNERNSKHK